MPRALASLLAVLTLGAGTLSRASADDAVPAGGSPPPAPAPAAAPANPGAADPAGAPAAGKAFATREEAAKSLFDALAKNDDATLREILGPGNDDLAQDGKDEAVRAQRALLAQTAQAKTTFDEQPDGHVAIVVGEAAYPLAIPLVKDAAGWRFDVPAGRFELLARRIGEHEIEAIGICLAYVEAQSQYASRDRDGDGVREYAQRLSSTPSRQDGLYWADAPGLEQSPVGRELAALKDAPQDGTSKDAPFDGYYWRVLKAQGPHAQGGAASYLVGDNMTQGFALLAVPAVPRNTGVQSFLVSRDGKVFQKDLGPDGLRAAAAIDAFDPDPSWTEVDAATIEKARVSSPEDAPFVRTRATPAVATSSREAVPGGTAVPAGGSMPPDASAGNAGMPPAAGLPPAGTAPTPGMPPPSSPCRPR